MIMVREVDLIMNEPIIQNTPFIFLNHLLTLDVSKFFHWTVEHPHRSRLDLRIPYLAIMVYVSYFLFSSYGILTSNREVL